MIPAQPMEEPFVALGIAPTQDMALVKQAYFRELAKHPPHQDPQGFQRLRRVYEALMRPGGLRSAYLRSPLDLDQELARYDERLRDRLAASPPPAPASDQFLDLAFGVTLENAMARFG